VANGIEGRCSTCGVTRTLVLGELVGSDTTEGHSGTLPSASRGPSNSPTATEGWLWTDR
jgi:hypothetical protein